MREKGLTAREQLKNDLVILLEGYKKEMDNIIKRMNSFV